VGWAAERVLLLWWRRAPWLLGGRLTPLLLRRVLLILWRVLLVLRRVLLILLRRILRARVLLRVWRWVALGVLGGIAVLLLRRARVGKLLHLRLAFCEQFVKRAGHGEVRTADD
jgi:hypothetical protein